MNGYACTFCFQWSSDPRDLHSFPTRRSSDLVLPMLEKAERDRSMMRPRTKGPRSLMRTTTLLPFFTLVTLTLVPKGRVRCAAVFRLALYSSPLAVLRFWNLSA